jgi:predicted nuclease of predicted toxin-antitoxin system
MPRSTARVLREAGHVAVDVRDIGLRGKSDAEIFTHAQASGTILVTTDKGFSNVLSFAPGSHAGIIVVRIPNEISTTQWNLEIARALHDLEGEDLTGQLVIVEMGRTRLRRKS